VYYLTNQTTTMFFRFSGNGGKNYFQPKGIQLNMSKIIQNGGVVERNRRPDTRNGLPSTIILLGTVNIKLFWLDEQHAHQKDIIFFGIDGINPDRSCYGYEHNTKFPPQIIHVGATKDPNIYIVFIVYLNEVIRLRLVLNTSAESSSPSLEIMSIYSWNIRICDISKFKEKMKQLSISPKEVKDVDDIIQYLETYFGQNSFGFCDPK
jgi:hypothetical protein